MGMTKEMRQAMEDCTKCHTMCMETMAQCMEMGCEASMMKTLMQCAQMCTMCADALCCGSEFTTQICDLCAQMCETCAKMCEKTGGDMMMKCAEMCRVCARSCAAMMKTAEAM